MLGDIEDALRRDFSDREYAEEYAKAFLNSFIATQIKVIREQRQMTQAELGQLIGTTQAGISRIEDINYSSLGVRTLLKLASAFDVRLRVSFETYGSLPAEVVSFGRESLERVSRAEDPNLQSLEARTAKTSKAVDIGAWKALSEMGQREGSGGGKAYGSGGDNESSRGSDYRAGFFDKRREDSPDGLHWPSGEQVRLQEISRQA